MEIKNEKIHPPLKKQLFWMVFKILNTKAYVKTLSVQITLTTINVTFN